MVRSSLNQQNYIIRVSTANGKIVCIGMRIRGLPNSRTPPGAIFTVSFDDETHALELVKRTDIPKDQPISWMTFDVRQQPRCYENVLTYHLVRS